MTKRRIVILLGPKGSGKTTAVSLINKHHGALIKIEDLFFQFDPNLESTVDHVKIKIDKKVYKHAYKQLLKAYKQGKTVFFDVSGSSPFFQEMLEKLKKKAQITIVLVTAEKELCWKRVVERDKKHQRPTSREYFDYVYDRVAVYEKTADYIIRNNGKKEDYEHEADKLISGLLQL